VLPVLLISQLALHLQGPAVLTWEWQPLLIMLYIKRCTYLALIIMATCASAQIAPAPVSTKPVGETIELSPFVITEGSEKGYVATSSLAGSRLKTDLKDIAAQVDVMTPEFLNDIAAISLDEAVQFSTNNGTPNEQNTGSNDGTQTTRAGGRARGFDAITQSSDFYETSMPSDFYNIERLTIANGPQSILFGLGNAGGAIDVSTKRALMRNRYELAYRTDSEGTSRTMFDANLQIVPQKVAVRVVGLKSNVNSTLEGAFNDQKRLFGTFTWKAARNTTVRMSVERMLQTAAVADNYLAQDFLSPWVYAGRPLFDNSTGNAGVPATGSPFYARNGNALRVIAYGGNGIASILPWNGTARTIGPNEVPNRVDTRKNSIFDNSIYPNDRSPRVNGRLNKLNGKQLRGAVEQRITDNFFVELGFNWETVHELRGGPFSEAESIDIYADPNRYLPGGTAARPQTTPNPNAGKMYIESFQNGVEQVNKTEELRLTTSYEFDFARRFQSSGLLRWFGKHRLAGLISKREDEDRSQTSRANIHGNTSFTTGDLSNNSRLFRTRYYLDPAVGNFSAGLYPGGSAFGPWAFTDSTTGETFTASLFDNPAGRTSAVGGSRKEINTYMLALQSFFWKDRINLFGGRRIDDFKSYLIDPAALIRGDYLAANDRRGLFRPLAQTGFDRDPAIDKRGKTYAYGAVVHPLRWLSLFASKSENTALPPGFLDPDNRQIPGIYSNGYDYGFRVSLKDDAISMRVNLYREHQYALIGDGQAVRTAAAVIENRLRGPDRPAGIATVAADGYDPVDRGDVYRSVEDKIAHGMDVTLTARLTANWDVRLAVGKQQTHVFNKSKEFNAWVVRRLPVWQQFGGLGWQNVAISASDARTVQQYYDAEILREVLRSELRNDLPRFRQREWRANAFTNYRFTEGVVKGLNVGGGVRWFGPAVVGYVQKPFPTAADPNGTVDDVTNALAGPETMFVDFLAGYGGRTKIFGGKAIGWRVQLNVRNLFEPDGREPIRTRNDGLILQYARVEPRQIILNTSFTF
jgi:outer membrane receptor protein involved in Fe transport